MNRNFLLRLPRRCGRTEKCVPYYTVIPANECCTEWGAMSVVIHPPTVWKVLWSVEIARMMCKGRRA